MGRTQTITFRAEAPARGETKFGGQPDWVAAPQWPLSRETGNPMRFLCQIRLDRALFPEARGEMAYLFMTDEDDYVDGTWEPEGGENCVVIQPGGAPLAVETLPQATGPSLYAMIEKPGHERLAQEAREYAAALAPQQEPDYAAPEAREDWSEQAFEEYARALEGNKIGGAPLFLQYDEFPAGAGWQLLLQLDSVNVPFYVNFGDAGIGYAFINREGTAGRLLWQCA